MYEYQDEVQEINTCLRMHSLSIALITTACFIYIYFFQADTMQVFWTSSPRISIYLVGIRFWDYLVSLPQLSFTSDWTDVEQKVESRKKKKPTNESSVKMASIREATGSLLLDMFRETDKAVI